MEGQSLISNEIFDFLETVRDATESFKVEANRKGLQYDLIEHTGLPQWVYGDQRCIRQAICNVIANAMDNTTTGSVRVELWLEAIRDGNSTIEVTVQDSGTGMSDKRLGALFRDLEQVTSENRKMFEGTENRDDHLVEGKGDQVLGLGLAVVARTVRNMNVQLRLKSEEGQGGRFITQLPFSLPEKYGQVPSIGDTAFRPYLNPAGLIR